MEMLSAQESWRDSVDASVMSQHTAEERQRQEVIFELITTERSYLADLRLIIKTYSHEALKTVVGDEEEELLVGGFVELVALSDAFLEDLVTMQKESQMVVMFIGDVLVKHIPRFRREYIDFCSENVDVNLLIGLRSRSDANFERVMQQCKTLCGNMDLQSFRLKPMQRLTRYPLLAAEILRHTPASHPDFASVTAALNECQTLVVEVNEHLRDLEMQEEMERLAAVIVIPEELQPFPIIESGRLLKHFGKITRGKKSKNRLGSRGSSLLLLKHGESSASHTKRFSIHGPGRLYLFTEGDGRAFLVFTQV